MPYDLYKVYYWTNKQREVHRVKFFEWVIRHKAVVSIVFVCAAAVSGILIPGVEQNYDMSKYLPEN